ncbi:MAG: hypothetical protein KAH30_02875, partial [Caldisericia bacterium]|nr:hypothetical protein [Caldisericia bacterium]
MTVVSMEKVECPCGANAKEVCMCFTVERVACSSKPPKVYGYDENGNIRVLYMDDANECEKMEIGSCWKLCANFYGESEGSFRVLKEVNAEPTTCPCVPDNEICICVEIVRTACGGEVPLVYAKDKDGKMWVLLLENDDYCGMMQIGTCWSVCGNPAGLQGNIKAIKVTWQEKVDCPCGEEPEEICFCVVVEDPACHGNAPMVYVKDKNGDQIVLYMKDSYDCEQMKQGECWEVCGEWMTAVTGQKAFKVTSKKKVRCPCGEEKPECDEIVKGIVKYLGCRENDQIELEVNGQLILYRSKHARVCTGFEIGDCVEACIMNVAGAAPIIIYMKKLDPKECESGDCVKILKGEIVDIGCTAYGYLKLKTPFGIMDLTIRDIDVCEDFEIGDCVMVCLIKDPHNDDKLIIDWMDTISDDQCPSDEKEICICATIVKSYCGLDRPYILVKDEKGNRWIVYLENGYDCEKMKPGSCWTVCGRPIEGKDGIKGIKITYFEKVDCPCLSEEITLCVTVQDPACGGNIPKVYALLPNGKQIVLYFDGKDECNRMKPEECWEIHGSWFFDETTGVVGFKVASMEKTDCPCGKPEPNDEFDMIIYGTSCDLRMPYYTAVFKGHLYNVYLPSNFDCKKFKVYDCIKVKGKLDKKNITAVSIVKRECAIRGLYGCTVVST